MCERSVRRRVEDKLNTGDQDVETLTNNTAVSHDANELESSQAFAKREWLISHLHFELKLETTIRFGLKRA